ncbi:MAG: hypothetical protein QGH60_18465 [Phycisphaerae bacterium]|jgi:hypothetical protein|nr:hypothetical protein [Phycisphaerae bacterium]
MKIESYLQRRFRRLTSIVLALACLAGWSIVFPPARAEGGALVIPAWSFARGNARIHANPNEYADAGPVIGSGPKRAWGWTVEYDIDIPVTAKYTLQVCYASSEARPIEVSLDEDDPGNRCCFGVTFAPVAGGRSTKLTSNSSGAKWEPMRRRGSLSLFELKLDKGRHTLKIARGGPLPHIVALRLDTPTEFPADYKAPQYKVRDLESVPAAYHKVFKPGGGIADRPIPEAVKDRPAVSLNIPACTFDRGNARIYASPDKYADAGPMAGGGPAAPETSTVEYDIDFPADGEYTLQIRYSAAEARPTDVWLDAKRLGTGCNGVTVGSSRFELPVTFSWISRVARWEPLYRQGKLARLSVSRGKHTLKLTRRGPLPNLVALRLIGGPAIGGPQSERRVDLSRVPPRYRSVFLAPGEVNTAALRQAIAHTTTRFGPQYPDGGRYLEQLSQLEARQSASVGGPEQLQKVHDDLIALRSEALLSHPALKFDKLLFIKRKAAGYGHTYSDQHSGDMGGGLCVLSPVSPEGKVTRLVPQLEGGLFDRFDLSFDAKKVVFGYRPKGKDDEKGKTGRRHNRNPESYRIYEIDLNPATGLMVPGSLRQLTFGGGDEDARAIRRNKNRIMCVGRNFDDMDPCYLPNGKIMFTSTRAMQIVFCAPGASVTNLYIIDADGKNLRRISDSPVNETAPSVMEDGRVIYTRWEYVDKGLGNGQSLWVVRPDGTGVDHVYKNNTVWPAAMSSARSIPDSQRIVTVGGTHHFTAVGPVILVDARRSRRTTEAMDCITPEVGYPSSMGYPRSRFGMFMDPYPFSEKFFLVSHRLSIKNNRNARYGLYALDAWGNRAALHRDPDMSCFQALPLRPRRKPTAVAAMSEADNPKQAKPAALFVQDVYVGMKGIARGRVKYLRVMGALPWAWNHHGISWSLGHKGDPHRKKIYGVAKVHQDGSAYFTAPAGENIFFQALDENYMALQQMPTFINMMPGETRSCIGCHELRRKAPSPVRALPTAMKYPPQALTFQPGDKGPRMVHYATDVQPILNKHCLRCHSGKNPKGRLDLTGEPTHKYDRGYESLINKRLVSFADCRYGSSNFVAVPPLTRGSHLSKLCEQIRKDPCKAKITRAEFIRIATWIDANVPYYGTYRGKRNPADKDCPDFRLPPLVAAP